MFRNKEKTGLKWELPDDPRNVMTSQYIEMGSSAMDKKYYGYPKSKYDDIEIESQGKHGSCVGQTFGKDKELREGKDISKRYVYKITDILYENNNGGGLLPQNAARMMTKIGGVEEKHCKDNNRLRAADYDDVKLLTGVEHYKNEGYAFVPRNNILELKKAFNKHKTLPMAVAKGKFNRRSGLLTGGGNAYHAVLGLGVEKLRNGKHKVFFVNSWGWGWGKKGIGYFIFEDLVESKTHFYFIATSKIPKKIIEQNRKMYPTLRKGSTGKDVIYVQNFFGITPDGIFGRITKRYVILFQIKRGLMPDGIVGKNTWKALLGK